MITFADTTSDIYTCTSNDYIIVEDCITSRSVYETTIRYDKSMRSSFIFGSSGGTSTVGSYFDGWGETTCSGTLCTGTIIVDNSRQYIYFPKLTKKEKKHQRIVLARAIYKGQLITRQKAHAEEKANVLLAELIGNKEHEIYLRTGRLFVSGEHNDYIMYREGDMKRIEKDKIVDMCVHLKNKHMFPKTDNVIALMLSLQHNEKHVLKIANDMRSRELPEVLPLAACM
jgi:hypothetical protein